MSRELTFLVVDDNDLDIEKVERAFKRLNIVNPLVRAKDGYAALEHLRGSERVTKLAKPYVVLLCPASAGNGEQCSAVKLTEGTHEKNTKALHSPREGRHSEAASGGQGAGLEALRRAGAAADGVLPLAERVL